MILSLALSTLALAHNGEDHSAPPPGLAAAEGARVPTWSSELEAVLATGDAQPGVAHAGTLWVANYRTSAPEPAGRATIKLEGDSPFEFQATSTEAPGAWAFSATFPSAGPWSGDLMILTPERSDVLGLPAFSLEDPFSDADSHDLSWTVPLAVGAAGLVAGVVLGLLLGRLGRPGRHGAVPAALLGLLLISRAWAHGGEDHSAPPPAAVAGGGLRLPLDSQFLLELRTTVADHAPFVEAVRASGTTLAPPNGAADLHAPVLGVLAWPSPLTPGDLVQAGDVLAIITETLSAVDRSSQSEARAAAGVRLAEARMALTIAERDAAKAPDLGGSLSDRERMVREQTLVAAREQLRLATEASDALRGRTATLRAPMTGRISAILARPGSVVSPAESVLRLTGDGGGLWVSASVPETWAGRLRTGDEATVTSDAFRTTGGTTPLRAHVLDPGLEADPASGTLRVVLALDEPAPSLVPGMSVTASIAAGAPRDAMVVPDAAIVDSAGETLVFIKTAPERFEERRVRTGALSGDTREIVSGVQPGERVVVQATYALRSLAGR